MAAIDPGPGWIMRLFRGGSAFFDRHFIVVSSSFIALQAALIVAVFAPLHRSFGPWDLTLTAFVFVFSLYSTWRVVKERFLTSRANPARMSAAVGWLAQSWLRVIFVVLVMLPARLLLFSAAMAAVVYDLVVDHGLPNPFAAAFDAVEILLFFLDQALRRLLFDVLGVFGIHLSHLTLAGQGAGLLTLALVGFRVVVEAITIGYLVFLFQHYRQLGEPQPTPAALGNVPTDLPFNPHDYQDRA